jgi:hypothetical protein
MNSRSIIYIIAIITVLAVIAIVPTMFMSPPDHPNEGIIKMGETDWSLDTDPKVYGNTIWATYADYEGKSEDAEHGKTIKVYYNSHLGAVTFDNEIMSWKDVAGVVSTHSLTLEDMVSHLQVSEAVFKFSVEGENYRVSFSIPKENGQDKYSDLTEAWNQGELYQTVELW